MGEHLTPIMISIAGPAVLTAFGFLWKLLSKINILEKQIEANARRIASLSAEVHKLNDKTYSIVKNL